MELANLTPAELASAQKADASGVVVEARDPSGNLIEAPVVPPAVPAPAAGKTKPEGLPDKFWNAEKGEADYAGLAKSYTELEKARGKPAEPAKPAAPAKSPAVIAAEAALAAAQAADPANAAAAAAAAAGITPTPSLDDATNAASAEYAKDGKLSDATYESLAKSGVSRSMVDTYIAGQVAQSAPIIAEAHAMAGGPEGYKAATDWARVNWTPQQISDFDAGVKNRATTKLAVADLVAKFNAANGTDGSLVKGGNGSPGNTGGGYATQTEVMAAINDPRYKKDAAYRATVEAKLGRTADSIL